MILSNGVKKFLDKRRITMDELQLVQIKAAEAYINRGYSDIKMNWWFIKRFAKRFSGR